MPIPFHDVESIEELGTAAFLQLLCISDEPANWVGCIFVINARGEPLEFVYNRVELLPSVLWRASDPTLAAARRLLSSLFAATVLTPKLVFVPETPATDALLGANRSFWTQIPDVRVRLPEKSLQTDDQEPDARAATVIWGSRPPGADTSRLYDLISARGLLFEPFERALVGLREVYPEWAKLIS